MSQILIEAAINVPDKPVEFDTITQADWEKIMKGIWLHWWKVYYQQYQEEIDDSLAEFTHRVFEIAEEKSLAGTAPGPKLQSE